MNDEVNELIDVFPLLPVNVFNESLPFDAVNEFNDVKSAVSISAIDADTALAVGISVSSFCTDCVTANVDTVPRDAVNVWNKSNCIVRTTLSFK